MEGNFVTRYQQACAGKESVLCLGLDFTREHVPPQFGRGQKAIEAYAFAVIDAAAELVPVVKPQYAYYGAEGRFGQRLLRKVTERAHERGLLVIEDAKRNDIGDTMSKYGVEVFVRHGVDACTFSSYLGSTFIPWEGEETEAWLPWLRQGKGPIAMVLTSNPQACQLQLLKLESGLCVFEHMAEQVKAWDQQVKEMTNGAGFVGGVVGATYPEQAESCRRYAGDDVLFLIPGMGAQGGTAKTAVAGLLSSQGVVMGVVNNSRGLTRDGWRDKKTKQPKPGDPLENVVAAIKKANSDLNAELVAILGPNPYATTKRYVLALTEDLERKPLAA